MKFRSFFFLLLGIAVFLTGCQSLREYHEREKPAREVVADIDEAFIQVDLEFGRVMDERNADRLMRPASLAKLYSAVFTLEILGPKKRFSTDVFFSGRQGRQVAKGDLILKGYGDPSLEISDLIGICRDLSEKGFRKIEGRFLYDVSEFEDRAVLNGSFPYDGAYNPGLSPLSLESNRFYAFWKNSAQGLEVYSVPSLPMIQFDDPSPVVAADKKFGLRATEDVATWSLSQRVKSPGKERLPITDSGMFTAQTMQSLCRGQGVELPNPEKGRLPRRAKKVLSRKGKTILKIVTDILKTSDNAKAELVTMLAARHESPSLRRWSDVYQRLNAWIRMRIPGQTWEGFYLENASGLATQSRVSPRHLAALLGFLKEKKYGKTYFMELLPLGGWNGTLKGRLTENPTSLKVLAKTGTTHYVSNLAGFGFPKSGESFAFAIMTVSSGKRDLLDRELSPRAQNLSLQASNWTKDARRWIDAQVLEWFQKSQKEVHTH